MSTVDLSPKQLRKAADLKERIEALQKKLTDMLGVSAAAPAASPEQPKKRKRNMSAAGRARIGAAARARWAALRAAKGSPKPARTSKRKLSAEGRAALSAAAKARWAKAKKAGKSKL